MTSTQVLRAQQGDRDAFADLVRSAHDRLYATASADVAELEQILASIDVVR
jgi:hypothetical protein